MKKTFMMAAVLMTISVTAQAAEQPMNVIFILADDLGICDVTAYARRFTGKAIQEMYYETPHLDRLVAEGMAFSQAYACQLCSPTRTSLLTGKNAARVGVTTATPGSVRSYYNQGITPPAAYLPQDAIYWGDNIKAEQALVNGSTLLALPAGQPGDRARTVWRTTLCRPLPRMLQGNSGLEPGEGSPFWMALPGQVILQAKVWQVITF